MRATVRLRSVPARNMLNTRRETVELAVISGASVLAFSPAADRVLICIQGKRAPLIVQNAIRQSMPRGNSFPHSATPCYRLHLFGKL